MKTFLLFIRLAALMMPMGGCIVADRHDDPPVVVDHDHDHDHDDHYDDHDYDHH